jgi:hypothetical protein
MDQLLRFQLNASYLLLSLLWSTIGAGMWIYGKKQRSGPALFGGLALIAISWLISSAIWMSVVAIAIIVGAYLWSREE